MIALECSPCCCSADVVLARLFPIDYAKRAQDLKKHATLIGFSLR